MAAAPLLARSLVVQSGCVMRLGLVQALWSSVPAISQSDPTVARRFLRGRPFGFRHSGLQAAACCRRRSGYFVIRHSLQYPACDTPQYVIELADRSTWLGQLLSQRMVTVRGSLQSSHHVKDAAPITIPKLLRHVHLPLTTQRTRSAISSVATRARQRVSSSSTFWPMMPRTLSHSPDLPSTRLPRGSSHGLGIGLPKSEAVSSRYSPALES